MVEQGCPQRFDIEPTCFVFNPHDAIDHAQYYVDKLELTGGIRPAVALIIPSSLNQDQILYGKRDPQYSKEFPGAWGLPSSSISLELFKNLSPEGREINHDAAEQCVKMITQDKQKLPVEGLYPLRIVGWTGRIRTVQHGYDSDYYLLMTDIMTGPLDPSSIPANSIAYTNFSWMTTEQHMAAVEENPSRACGACSSLAHQFFNKTHE